MKQSKKTNSRKKRNLSKDDREKLQRQYALLAQVREFDRQFYNKLHKLY
jgi:hypothetical protein